MTAPTVLDLGCGRNKVAGSVGCDVAAVPGVDLVTTVDRLALRDRAADVVYAIHVLEHVPSLVDAMDEIWRACKPGARVHIWCPHFSCGLYTWGDPTHRRAMSSITFDQWEPGATLDYYSAARFQVVTRELHYAFRRDVGTVHDRSAATAKLKRFIARLVEPLANRNRILQLVCERFWANWVGFEEIYFELVCVKDT